MFSFSLVKLWIWIVDMDTCLDLVGLSQPGFDDMTTVQRQTDHYVFVARNGNMYTDRRGSRGGKEMSGEFERP